MKKPRNFQFSCAFGSLEGGGGINHYKVADLFLQGFPPAEEGFSENRFRRKKGSTGLYVSKGFVRPMDPPPTTK